MAKEPKIRTANAPLKWALRAVRSDGITLPPLGIFITKEFLSDAALIRHEQAHWRQAQELGVVKFYAKYLWFNMRYGYRNNPMEIEARQAENLT